MPADRALNSRTQQLAPAVGSEREMPGRGGDWLRIAVQDRPATRKVRTQNRRNLVRGFDNPGHPAFERARMRAAA